jgi:hypothetical protein
MSTIFWNALKFSPAILGASLLVASSTYAREIVPEQAAATSTSQAVATVEPAVEPLAQLPQTKVVASSTDAPESALDQTAAASTTQLAATVKPAVEPLTQLPQTKVEETSVSQLTPTEASPRLKGTESTLAQQVPATDNTTPESTQLLQEIQRYNGEDSGESSTNALDQITNVTQLRDVSPGDWAYEALRSLVERYGCIAGYPDGTFRGNRAMSRYEFAAGLNACLSQIERLITEGGRDFVTRQEFETLQRLVQEFQAELTTLGTRVDTLEGRVGSLEDRQFSTTTKLRGEVIFAVSDLFGDQDASGNDYARTETVFQDRVRLAFDTSFTGKDLLRTRLEAGNITEFGPLTGPAGPGANITREGRFGFQVDNGNDVVIDRLYYRFPLGNLAQVYLAANGRYEDFVPLLNGSFEPSGTGALSRFGRYSPIYRMGNQNQGIGVSIGTKSPIRVDLGYFSENNVGNNPNEKFGLFDGNHTALGQVTFQPSNAFRIAATYVNSYNNQNRGLNHGTGSIASQVAAGAGRPVVGQSYGLEASFAFTPQLVLSGWGAYTKAIVIETGEADVWNYGATLAINDLGTKGSTLGFVVGMEPKLTGSDRTVGPLLAGGLRRDPDTGLHIEGFYKFKLTDNILITPGVIWLTAPGHNSDNDDIVIGTLRTTFTF